MWCLPQREVYFSGWKDLFFPFKFAILKSCSCLNLQYSKAVHTSQADALICSSVKNASSHPVGKVNVFILADCIWDALERRASVLQWDHFTSMCHLPQDSRCFTYVVWCRGLGFETYSYLVICSSWRNNWESQEFNEKTGLLVIVACLKL